MPGDAPTDASVLDVPDLEVAEKAPLIKRVGAKVANTRHVVPGLATERTCWDSGDRVVVGLDEVGRGAWAGPVTVAALVAPADRRLYKLRDSKALTRVEREGFFDRIMAWAPAVGVGHASHDECDAHGMTEALRRAGRRALESLATQGFEPDRVLIDGHHDYLGLGRRAIRIIGGDARCLSIAAASIIAKVTRDRLMADEAEHFPWYGFDSNVGYPAPVHQAALAALGPTAIHRRSWIFMDGLPWNRVPPPQGALF